MKLLKLSSFLILLFVVSCEQSCKSQNTENTNKPSTKYEVQAKPQHLEKLGKTIQERFIPPSGYQRIPYENDSFQKYLRNLKLKPHGSTVKYYNGDSKPNNDVYAAVVDLDIGTKNLHQCADAVMRLYAEHLWNQKEYNDIHFNFTNGLQVDYSEWMKGRRMVLKGNKTYWNNRNQPSNTYEDFWKYMELIFAYAGTASLEKELQSINIYDADIGDILIIGGHPGHAVIIIDKVHKDGKNLYLLAQSYMPAQEIQILNNPINNDLSPWFELQVGTIQTPEWNFDSSNLKRFRD